MDMEKRLDREEPLQEDEMRIEEYLGEVLSSLRRAITEIPPTDYPCIVINIFSAISNLKAMESVLRNLLRVPRLLDELSELFKNTPTSEMEKTWEIAKPIIADILEHQNLPGFKFFPSPANR